MQRKQAGFTALEVIVVLAIASVLGLLAAPALGAMVGASRIAGQVNAFLDDLRFARSEALRRGTSVTMCRSADPQAAAPACDSDGNSGWERGWIIFVDADGDNARASDEPLLRVQQALSGSGGIRKEGGAAAPGYLRFRASGLLVGMEATIGFNPPPALNRPDLKRQVAINATGRARVVDRGLL